MSYELFDHSQASQPKKIYLVDMRQEKGFFAVIMEQALIKAVEKNHRVLIVVNKVGYASGISCLGCGDRPTCRHCDVCIAYHRLGDGQLMGLCHICKTVYNPPKACDHCGSTRLHQSGLTIQKTQDRCTTIIPGCDPVILDAGQLTSIPKITRVQEKIRQTQIIISTAVTFGGLGGWIPDVIIIPGGDQGLSLPDYTSADRNFWYIYDYIQSYPTTNYIIQSYDTHHPSIRYACAMDTAGRHIYSDTWKNDNHYPPHTPMCIIKYNHLNENALHTKMEMIAKEIALLIQHQDKTDTITVYTCPPLVYKKFDKYYYHIILQGQGLRELMDYIYPTLRLASRGCKIDWMPESLL